MSINPEFGQGNVIFLDGSAEGMDKTMKQIIGMMQLKEANRTINQK